MKEKLAIALFFVSFLTLPGGCVNTETRTAAADQGYVVSHGTSQGKTARAGHPVRVINAVSNEEDRENYFYGRYGLY